MPTADKLVEVQLHLGDVDDTAELFGSVHGVFMIGRKSERTRVSICIRTLALACSDERMSP